MRLRYKIPIGTFAPIGIALLQRQILLGEAEGADKVSQNSDRAEEDEFPQEGIGAVNNGDDIKHGNNGGIVEVVEGIQANDQGNTGLPNSPSMAATRAKMESPPPIAMERLLRSKTQEVKKHRPDSANRTRKAPTFSKIRFA